MSEIYFYLLYFTYSYTFTFIILLIQKQCINFINSEIYIDYWPSGTVSLKKTTIHANKRMGADKSVGTKHNRYYSTDESLCISSI